MARCPYCTHRVSWWEPLVTWRDETLFCPHCGRALRVDRWRYGVLSGVSVAGIASVNLLPAGPHYLLLCAAAAIAVVLCVVFGRVVKAESNDDT